MVRGVKAIGLGPWLVWRLGKTALGAFSGLGMVSKDPPSGALTTSSVVFPLIGLPKTSVRTVAVFVVLVVDSTSL